MTIAVVSALVAVHMTIAVASAMVAAYMSSVRDMSVRATSLALVHGIQNHFLHQRTYRALQKMAHQGSSPRSKQLKKELF